VYGNCTIRFSVVFAWKLRERTDNTTQCIITIIRQGPYRDRNNNINNNNNVGRAYEQKRTELFFRNISGRVGTTRFSR